MTVVSAQQPHDPRVADVVSSGRIRLGLFLPQFEKDTQVSRA